MLRRPIKNLSDTGKTFRTAQDSLSLATKDNTFTDGNIIQATKINMFKATIVVLLTVSVHRTQHIHTGTL